MAILPLILGQHRNCLVENCAFQPLVWIPYLVKTAPGATKLNQLLSLDYFTANLRHRKRLFLIPSRLHGCQKVTEAMDRYHMAEACAHCLKRSGHSAFAKELKASTNMLHLPALLRKVYASRYKYTIS